MNKTKTRLLTIIGIIMIVSWLLPQNSEAMMLIGDPVNNFDVIVSGTITSASSNYDKIETEYEVSIEKIVKGAEYLNETNQTKILKFISPGVADTQNSNPFSHTDYKIFTKGDRTLLLLSDKNSRLEYGLSRVTTTSCTAKQMMQLYYVPGGGIVLHQNGLKDQPFHTNKSITAQFFYVNLDLTQSEINVRIQIIDDFPEIHHVVTFTLNLEECQAYAMAETEFVIKNLSSFAISVEVDVEKVEAKHIVG